MPELVVINKKPNILSRCVLPSPACSFEIIYIEDIVLRVIPSYLEPSIDPPLWLLEAWNRFWRGERPKVKLGTPKRLSRFSEKVYEVVEGIPFGHKKTYGEVAALAGNPKGARAVGTIMRYNPWPPFVPCHRVIGKDGDLLGYGGPQGIKIKEALIAYEAKVLNNPSAE